MCINYRLSPVKDNINKKRAKVGWYAQVLTKGTIDTRELCADIASKCTLTRSDMYGAIAALSDAIAEKLQDGYNVYIDGLGTFSVSAGSDVVEDEKDIHNKDVRVKGVKYRAAVDLKNSLKKAKFAKAKKGDARKYTYGDRYRH